MIKKEDINKNKNKNKNKKKKEKEKKKDEECDDEKLMNIPSFTEIKLKKAIKMNDIKDNNNGNILNESSMNRISQISRLDNRNLFSYIIDSDNNTNNNNGTNNNNNNEINDNQSQQTITFKQNARIKLLNEWIFDVFNQSKGIQRLLSICLKRMDNFINKSPPDIDMNNIDDGDDEEEKNKDDKEIKM